MLGPLVVFTDIGTSIRAIKEPLKFPKVPPVEARPSLSLSLSVCVSVSVCVCVCVCVSVWGVHLSLEIRV